MSPPPPFSLERSVTHRLHTIHKLTDRITQQAYLAATGLPLGEGRCLAAVASFGPFSVNDLAGWANLNKGQASRAAQTLVDQGLVSKTTSDTDSRGVVLTLTPRGERVWEKLRAAIAQRNEEIVACLDDAQRRQLDSLLERLVAHARQAACSTPHTAPTAASTPKKARPRRT